MAEEARPPRVGQARDEFVTMQEAASILGVSRFQMAALVKRRNLKVYETETDLRRKLLRRSDIEGLGEPRPKCRAA